jgi:membrane-bound serine protease (ClpP class)
VTSAGALAVSGAIAIAIGGIMLFPGDSGPGVSRWLAAGVAIVFGGGLAMIATRVIAARRSPPSSHGGGAPGMIGERGVARTRLDPQGLVFVHGELWTAATPDPPIPAGAPVAVRAVHGLALEVELVAATPEEATGTSSDHPLTEVTPSQP